MIREMKKMSSYILLRLIDRSVRYHQIAGGIKSFSFFLSFHYKLPKGHMSWKTPRGGLEAIHAKTRQISCVDSTVRGSERRMNPCQWYHYALCIRDLVDQIVLRYFGNKREILINKILVILRKSWRRTGSLIATLALRFYSSLPLMHHCTRKKLVQVIWSIHLFLFRLFLGRK